MRTVGIIGAGTMGAGMANVAAVSGFQVILCDADEQVLQTSLERIAADLQKGLERGKLTAQQFSEARERIHPHHSLESFSNADIVIEAVVEKLEVKQDIFRRLEAICQSNAIFATNTSSLSITAIASVLSRPERVVGMHFFNPAHLMKLVEIIRGHRTAEAVVSRASDLARALGKIPVHAKDTPGFIVNRCARPFYGEALRVLGEGIASPEDIDRIVKLEGGFKMGPFELMDLIGIDVNLAVTQSMYDQTFGEPRYRPHVIQKNMVNANLLGRKTKRGFYDYP
ncbi:MAG TPA: 3-hydroxyacyl-CoA dehydrogenase NAD-binding domain-containing protein [Bacteroidota bacterium]|jgi:3-hydroxybutyryl-CoA dehydrogenase|nr:3-hydroxyacyl-CoA dehydrogenase NAD-binding domain-containing protein [Bacteroidota bacterium]